jgi:formylglycine-generating enzyme required for sulfatase activity
VKSNPALAVPLAIAAIACSRSKPGPADAAADIDASSLVSAPAAIAPGAPKPGMIWIPSGVLRAGTPIDAWPRIADEELPGVDIALGGFYIDELAYPNESGAIPKTNVARDEATRLCAEKGKRLCTELEWERACRGPTSTRYEYGETYDATKCSTGVAIEQTARKPSGQRLTCVSGFGVREMHGGVWEWTDSAWGRGSRADLGVLRGGNSTAGEIVGRCANALGRAPQSAEPQMGFRCCAGPRNEAKVDLVVKGGQPLSKLEHYEELPEQVRALSCPAPESQEPCLYPRQWVWRPTGNVEIWLRSGCNGAGLGLRCGFVAATLLGDKLKEVARFAIGREIPDVVLVAGEGKNARARGGDTKGVVFREMVFVYGRVDVKGKEPRF